MDAVKGMALGVSNAIVIALAMAGCVAMGMPVETSISPLGGALWHAHDGAPPFEAVLETLLSWGIPAGFMWGLLIGSMVHEEGTPRWKRATAYTVASNFAMLISAVLWPQLLPDAFIPTTVHALILARWTREPFTDELARVRVVRSWRDRFRRAA